MIDLSLIIVNFNGKNFLKNCLDSILTKQHKLEYEIFVIDNASADGSVEMLKEKFPQIRLIKNKENIGFAAANNQALKQFRGRYALLLNNDTVIINDALEKMIQYMDKHPKAGVCGPRLLNPNGTVQREGSILSPRFWHSRVPVPVGFLTGACFLLRREAIDKVGLLDENFFFYNEDLDYCYRLKRNGWQIHFFPQAKVIHHKGQSASSISDRAAFEGYKGGLWLCKKHYPVWVYTIYKRLVKLDLWVKICWFFIFRKKDKVKILRAVIRSLRERNLL